MPARKRTSSQSSRGAKERKLTLSPTRISAYLDCAVKYRYIYQDKIGRFYSRARAGYSFGSTLHHVLQQFHEQGATHTPDEMKAGLEQNWIGAGYQSEAQEQDHREAGEQIVEAYHAAHQERVVSKVETIAIEKTITCDMGRFKLTGRVDRIDRHPDGALEIIDYKSGRLETSPEEVADSLAMSCYQLILTKLYPDTPVFASIYCLRSGNTASAALTGETLKQFEQDILALGDEILERDYERLEPVRMALCEDCDFLARCQTFWRERDRNERQGPQDGPHSDYGL